MQATAVRTRTDHKPGAGKTPSGPCVVLAQVASLRARFEAYALPDDFEPGYYLTETLDRIRQLHSNYSQLAEELELACIQRVADGAKCCFSEVLASGTDRVKCPALSLVWFTLKRVADEKSEEALTQWRQRTLPERSNL